MSQTNNLTRLTGKTALVTGASKGIGASIAAKLASEGAAVVVNYNTDAAGGQKVVEQIKERGGKAVAVQANVAHPNEAKSLVERAVSEFGKLDVLVNNAGIFGFAPLEQLTEDYFDRHFNTNVKGLLFVTQAAVEAFGAAGGKIINISSIVSTMPPVATSVYSATKGAVDTITRALAIELGAKNILVNAVSPGVTDTEGVLAMQMPPEANQFMTSHTALGRLGKPDDVAGAVAFLASNDADWITGQVIGVSGGLRM